MKISIIGSFRKYYEEIKNIILLLGKNNIEVLSPKYSEITYSIDDFVVFQADNHELTPEEIQSETLNRILKSDVVYVYNPEGYVGRTTCYEIGVLRTTTIPLIFLEKPKDLPIQVLSCEIMKPPKLIFSLLNDKRFCGGNERILIEKSKSKNDMRSKNIVICGSMAFYNEMLEIANYLKRNGVSVVIPKEESMEKETLSDEEFNDFKRKVSNQYLGKIRDSSTYAILVLNKEKKGISNYIGANTMVEIAMAFCWGRTIYLLDDYYAPLIDELIAWRAICLKRNLNVLIENYKNDKYALTNESSFASEIDGQIELGDIDEYFYPLSR